jgi:hypothetical protein
LTSVITTHGPKKIETQKKKYGPSGYGATDVYGTLRFLVAKPIHARFEPFFSKKKRAKEALKNTENSTVENQIAWGQAWGQCGESVGFSVGGVLRPNVLSTDVAIMHQREALFLSRTVLEQGCLTIFIEIIYWSPVGPP